MSNIILTLSTVPNRLLDTNENSGTKIGLKTLLDQSYSDYEIHFNIPVKYNWTNEDITIPDWLLDYQEKYPKLKIFRCDDSGPITKILPTLERVTDPNTIIITADDDLYYMDGMISAHVEARKKYPNYYINKAD
jgi:hypothetical protein